MHIAHFTDPKWLTAEYYRCGLLQKGHVLETDYTCLNMPDSASIFLKIRQVFSHNTRSLLPDSICIKLRTGMAGMAEVAFFQLLEKFRLTGDSLMPRLLQGYDSSSDISYLLMPDMTQSHTILQTQQQACTLGTIPHDMGCIAAIGTLAHFHGQCWQPDLLEEAAPILGRGCFWNREQQFAVNQTLRLKEFKAFREATQSWFPTSQLEKLEMILPTLSRLWRDNLQHRLESLQQVTIVHGDCYFRHFFYPLPDHPAPAYLFDFDQVTIQTPAYDLVQLLVSYWSPETRQEDQRESSLLRHYHATLCGTGVMNYSFQQLMMDYRVMVILQLFAAIKEQVRGCAKPLWLNRLMCLLGAFEDLDCQQLLS
ncbi:oxidoreductase family protein [Kistimonas scapharcae]